MTRESDKKTRLQIKKETYESRQAEMVANAEAIRAEDEASDKKGIVFTPTASMPAFEKFTPKIVTPVGPHRFKYLRATFPDNFRGAKMQDRTGIENKMAGGGDENKGGPSAPVVDDKAKVNTDDTRSSADDVTNSDEGDNDAASRTSAGQSTNSG